MIIDAHTHIWGQGWLPDWWLPFFSETLSRRENMSFEEAKSARLAALDPLGDKMVVNMTKAGIDKSMICCLDWGLVENRGDAPLSIEEINRAHSEACRRHPGKLFWAVGVDPRRKNAKSVLEKGVKEWGAKALKLYPPCGFYPNDRIVYPLYEKCIELGVPVDIHTGPISGPLRSKYSHPLHLDDVAVDFPELTIIATHTGHGSWQEMLAIARTRPNIICTISGWQWWRKASPLNVYQTVRLLMDLLGSPRLMFASDWSGIELEISLFT